MATETAQTETEQADVTIREARVEDCDGIAAILHALGWFEHINRQPVAQTQVQIAARIARCQIEKTHTILVAESKPHGVVGYVAVHWFPNLAFGHDGYVSELFLHPAMTDRGIGGRLLDAVSEYARKRGCTRLTLMNRRTRESYQRGFYAKHGWHEVSDAAFFTLPLPRG
ncbi:MAG: GNAT family N-acetyltransferase [Ktedonobacteraceae bacterium]|nr:GNAT family N-acetyltransferase [Ktedonobacteraceae bacterium]